MYNHYPYTYYRTGVLVNRLTELVFAPQLAFRFVEILCIFKKTLDRTGVLLSPLNRTGVPCSVEPPRAALYGTFSWKWGYTPHT